MFSNNDLKVKGRIPQKIVSKAESMLQDIANKVVHKNLMIKKHNSGIGHSVNVGRRYRLLKKTNATTWLLLSHEDYNKQIK
ncbi:TPA: hypothetical protein ACX6Q6_003570 [Photobacterium damselae]